MIDLAVIDVAGTTIEEGGTVYRVLAETVRAAGGDPSAAEIEAWMGASKREAIQALLAEPDDTVVDAAFADFRSRLHQAYRDQPPTPFAGVTEVIARLRAAGVKVALTTGFDRETTSSLIGSVGWASGVLDAVICIDDVPAGRPYPYMIFRAMEATGVADVRRVLVAGDTVRDIEAGRNAGAGIVVAVTTGEVKAETLAAADPTHVLGGVVDIPAVLG
jgi:phosphonatase-like hydrolase